MKLENVTCLTAVVLAKMLADFDFLQDSNLLKLYNKTRLAAFFFFSLKLYNSHKSYNLKQNETSNN